MFGASGCSSASHSSSPTTSAAVTTTVITRETTTNARHATASSLGTSELTGPTGGTGPTGPPGPPGAPGVSGYDIVQGSKTVPINNTDAPTGSVDLSVSCPTDQSVLSGGATITSLPHNAGDFAFLEQSDPVNESTWAATAEWNHSAFGGPNIEPQTLTLTVHAVCARIG